MSIDRLTECFREVFEDESLVLQPDLVAKDVKKWDSFNHINLMIALEEEFDVMLAPDEIHKARSVGDLVELLQTKGCEIKW
ncbi:MAG: acyl carrier protein [Rhodospirillaceae bacterium]|jgi:acyl carrier protein|nr:acyl carrier protein [Rhodospirillaceae bacterium]MBT5667653.1 acyl carrier protein [Rhodospirillaceae bacterium]